MRTINSRDNVSVGIICVLDCELTAILCVLDELLTTRFALPPSDPNKYFYGRIQEHIVVVVQAPKGAPTTQRAVRHMHKTFPAIDLALLCGTCGGVPRDPHTEIFLGDVAVATGINTVAATQRKDIQSVAYDARVVAQHLSNASCRAMVNTYMPGMRALIVQRSHEYDRPLQLPENPVDVLYDDVGPRSSFKYTSCKHCQSGHRATGSTDTTVSEIIRHRDENRHMRVFSGVFTCSPESTVRCAAVRENAHYSLAFDMESEAMLASNIPTYMIVKGIANYADSHKDESWNVYAAVNAASIAKMAVLILKNRGLDPVKMAGLVSTDAQMRAHVPGVH